LIAAYTNFNAQLADEWGQLTLSDHFSLEKMHGRKDICINAKVALVK